MKLYICFTYYHTLITLIKLLHSDEKADLLLANNIPNYTDLIGRLNGTGRFENIYEYDAIKFRSESKTKSALQRAMLGRRNVMRIVPNCINVTLEKYEDIYVYADMTGIGRYIIGRNINYHLIEDALDFFVYFDKYYDISDSSFSKTGFKKRIKNFFHIGFTCWGQAKCCLDIEVNSLNGIKVPVDKVKAVSRKEMFQNLTIAQKKVIYGVYVPNGLKWNNDQSKSVILLTQPLFEDHWVETEDQQLKVFEGIVNDLKKDGYSITIKPHPRDIIDYSNIEKRYMCSHIDKNIPSEVLNFNSEAFFDLAVSITSTAINFLENVHERRFIGREYINVCLKKGINYE